MIKHRVERLESVHIGYIDKYMDALVTEDGSTFYPSDFAFHEAMDNMIQNLSEKDQELFRLVYKTTPDLEEVTNRSLFYLNEKEFEDYCDESLNYLENSDSSACRFAKKYVKFSGLYDEYALTKLTQFGPDSQEAREIRKNWNSRAAPNENGVNECEISRMMTMLKLGLMNVRRGFDQLGNMRKYQNWNKGRKVILRIMSDRRVEDYDQWFLCCDDVLEACHLILEEEGRLDAKRSHLLMWNDYIDQTGRIFETVPKFEKLLKKLEIDPTRIILVPDVHFLRQWHELPQRVDYTCATVIKPDGEEGYRPIQAQLRIFEALVGDIDWEAAAKKHKQKSQQMRYKIINLLEQCLDVDFLPIETVENAINQMNTDNFFAEAKKRAMKTPLYIYQKKNNKYNDTIPIAEYQNLFPKYFHIPMPQGFHETEPVAIWKVRFIFLTKLIDSLLPKHKQLDLNLRIALTMQFEFLNISDAEKMEKYLRNEVEMGDRVEDHSEEMTEDSQIKELDAPKHIVSQKPPKKVKQQNKTNPEEPKPKIDTIGVEKEEKRDADETNDQLECHVNEKKDKEEIEDLKRQLAEKSKLLEDHENRVRSDGMRLHEMQKKLEIAQKMIAQQEETAKELEKSSRAQANKIKEDYKKENQKLGEKLVEKGKRCKQLELELKEIRDNVKKEQRKQNSKEDEESKKLDDNMKKMTAELEMVKLTLKSNSKTIDDLEKKNRELEIELDVQKEKIATSSMDSEKDERIRELTEKCENLELERLGMLADIEELSIRNLEVDKLDSKNHDLMIEINRLRNLSLEAAPSTSSEISFADLQNQLENKEKIQEAAKSSLIDQKCLICTQSIKTGNQGGLQCERCPVEYHQHCISRWLEMNPNCPACREHWPDPQEFPAL